MSATVTSRSGAGSSLVDQRLCAVCSPGVRLKMLGHEQFRCPRCSRLYDFTEETGAPHNNPLIAAQMNEYQRLARRGVR